MSYNRQITLAIDGRTPASETPKQLQVRLYIQELQKAIDKDVKAEEVLKKKEERAKKAEELAFRKGVRDNKRRTAADKKRRTVATKKAAAAATKKAAVKKA
jgi:hypothetical protein